MEKEWAVVLAGGGAKGAYQIGVWRALKECGYFDRIGAFSGDSIGAINLCLMAGSSQEKAQGAWKKINLLSVFDPDIGQIDGREGVFSREELLRLMDENIDYAEVSGREAYVNATQISENAVLQAEEMDAYSFLEYAVMKPVYFSLKGKDREEIRKIVLASSALPVLYEAVLIDQEFYRDGGLTDNLPVKPVYEAGYRKIILVLLDQNTCFDETKYPDCEFLVIRPSHDLGDLLDGTLNFTKRKIRLLLEFGYYDAMAQLAGYHRAQLVKTELTAMELPGDPEKEKETETRKETAEETLKRLEQQIKKEKRTCAYDFYDADQAYRQALYVINKEDLENRTQGEFDKVQSYMARYGIKF